MFVSINYSEIRKPAYRAGYIQGALDAKQDADKDWEDRWFESRFSDDTGKEIKEIEKKFINLKDNE